MLLLLVLTSIKVPPLKSIPKFKPLKKTIAIVGESLETYAFEKAIEDLFGLQDHSDDYISKDMQRGIDEEPLAFAMFSRKKALDFIDVEESEFCCYGDHAGASPDGVVSNNSGLEIKCPKRKQDLRADLPTVGLDTFKDCKKANIKGIVLKSNQNIFRHVLNKNLIHFKVFF